MPSARATVLKQLLKTGGITGAGIIGSQLDEDTAEAFPIRALIKGTSKRGVKMLGDVSKAAESRASGALKGTTFMNGVIKSITKAKGDTRHIVLEDDTIIPVTKDVVSNLMRTQGTQAKMTELGTKSGGDRFLQALKSLDYHERRMPPFQTVSAIKDNYSQYMKQMTQGGVDAPAYTLVKKGSKYLSLPSEYATILEKEGVIKIVRDLK